MSAMCKKQLGHAFIQNDLGYQRRRDRFRVNLAKASGLEADEKSPPLSGLSRQFSLSGCRPLTRPAQSASAKENKCGTGRHPG